LKNSGQGCAVEESLLQAARRLAQAGKFPELLAACRAACASPDTALATLLDIGSLLLGAGFLGEARGLLERACTLAPADLRADSNLAHLASAAGDHSTARHLYHRLLALQPDNAALRRSALTSLEYDPAASNEERFAQALAWGAWAEARPAGPRARPALAPAAGRPLRIGYVSADLCQHTVGLLVKDVIKTHDCSRVTVFAYSAGTLHDWVTAEIAGACTLRDVAKLDDAALAQLIRADAIDVLVDLSGHTGGSRLTVFAQRPAPVQVAWLGYFATTGLKAIDAVMLDPWHAPPGTEQYFVEKIVYLPQGRWCYQPVPWAPAELAAPPCMRKGYITFGCFNNTAKLNAAVFDAWARILAAVPASHLLLKWRTLHDEALRNRITAAFAARGIDPARLELRGPSFHADLLGEYADMDIALDPFPFTGGLTTCEALWMGVPVVTFPQSRVVSRQGLALLAAIGLPELAGATVDDYVNIATGLAQDPARMAGLRSGLRARMRNSPLMDLAGFTHQLEDNLHQLYQGIAAADMNTKKSRILLHVGPGHRDNGVQVPAVFQGSEWREVRLDADPGNEPDIVGSMLDMGMVATASIDAVYSAHNIEHVHTHEVAQVLQEFLRVLKPDGYLLVTCPDLQSVCQLVVEDKLEEVAYQSPAGPITPLDIMFGHGAAIAAGHPFMAHKTGFTLTSLTRILQQAGFQAIAGKRRQHGLDLWAVACKGRTGEAELRALVSTVLPA
jgi:protein O-GlcNAc transferase